MPDRILRANILTSESVNSLTWPAEVFYRRLMSIVDDFGRYDARPSVIRGLLYPLKLDRISDADIVKWLGECSKTGLVSCYQVDGKDYLEIQNFGQRLRAMKSRFPAPADNCCHLLAGADIVGHLPLETNMKQNTETKAKDALAYGENVVYSIEHCLTVAMVDDRFVKANKATNERLRIFNQYLEKQGIYEKNPADYKKHFANWDKTNTPPNSNSGYQSPRGSSWV
jgi:hypothetical protein